MQCMTVHFKCNVLGGNIARTHHLREALVLLTHSKSSYFQPISKQVLALTAAVCMQTQLVAAKEDEGGR